MNKFFLFGIFLFSIVSLRAETGLNQYSSLTAYHVSLNNCEPDPYEPNDTPQTAFPIIYGDTINAEICPLEDYDYFTFTAEQGEFIRVFEIQNSIPRVTIYILNQNLSPISNNLYQTDQRFFAPYSGVYYIVVTKSPVQILPGQYKIGLEKLSPAPDVLTVTDIPDDQGLQVRVVWKASIYDPQTGVNQTDFYALWRMVEDSTNITGIDIGSLRSADFNNHKLMNSTLFKYNNSLWDFVAQIPAVTNRPFIDYSYTAPTLYDETPTSFIVSAVPKAGFYIPVLWGNPGTGISYDNISPEFINYGIQTAQEKIELYWLVDLIIHYDITSFKVYRNTSSGFTPSEIDMIALLPFDQEIFIDYNINSGEDYFYRIEAVDNSGKSGWTSELYSSVTGINSDELTPSEFSLLQNYPNPFNPATVISYNLPSTSFVTLKVYNILGNEVAALVNELQQPGSYNVTFSAIGRDRNKLTSGVYIYKLTAGDFVQTRKMMLIK